MTQSESRNGNIAGAQPTIVHLVATPKAACVQFPEEAFGSVTGVDRQGFLLPQHQNMIPVPETLGFTFEYTFERPTLLNDIPMSAPHFECPTL